MRDATRPISACEMALIRLAYAAELPPADKLVKDILGRQCAGAARPPPAGNAPAARTRCASSSEHRLRQRRQNRAAADARQRAALLRGLEDVALDGRRRTARRS